MTNIRDKEETIEQIPPETISFMHTLKESIGSLSVFFSVGYTILIVISISYNLGYFKNINPQFIELMSIGDYINDTLDNLWFFIIFICLMFSSSLGATKRHDDSQFPLVISTAIVILLATIYTMFKGRLENKFLYIIRTMLPNDIVFYALVFIVLIIIILLSVLAYRFSYNFAKRRLPKYTASIACMLMFTFIVLLPYAFGISKSDYENELITKGDTRIHSVDIFTANNAQVLKGVYIVKELDKGVIVREYVAGLGSNESNLIFVHWNDIKRIQYQNFKKL